jgi:hypothetical protein
MRLTAAYNLLKHKNKIFLELNVDPVKKELAQYKQKWLNLVNRMEGIRYPK